jgi:hypothetical protein
MQFLLHASSWLCSDVLYCSLVFRRCYICPPQLAYFMHHIDARGPKKEDVWLQPKCNLSRTCVTIPFTSSLILQKMVAMSGRLAVLFFFALVTETVESFSAATTTLFQQQAARTVTAPIDVEQSGMVEIELPSFDELFVRIRTASPLAGLVLTGGENNDSKRGFEALECPECK